MSVKLARRVAAEELGRGEAAIRFRPESLDEIGKAITRDDIRRLIKSGAITAVKMKRELHKRTIKKKRYRGPGKRKGTANARRGMSWEKKTRAQRTLLKKLRQMGKLDRKVFRKYYLLTKGNAFPDKRSLLLHLSDDGIRISDEEMKQISEFAKKEYR